MHTRREFIGNAAGLAGALSVPSRVLGANDRIRVGIIGPGARGMSLVQQAIACPNTEFIAFADIYTKRLEVALKSAPAAKTYLDYRYLLDDKSIDAVLIATPQHLHCEHFVAALDAGKHVYQEKTMAFSVDHAKRMRALTSGPASAPCRSAIRTVPLETCPTPGVFSPAATWARSVAFIPPNSAIRRTARRSGRVRLLWT